MVAPTSPSDKGESRSPATSPLPPTHADLKGLIITPRPRLLIELFSDWACRELIANCSVLTLQQFLTRKSATTKLNFVVVDDPDPADVPALALRLRKNRPLLLVPEPMPTYRVEAGLALDPLAILSETATADEAQAAVRAVIARDVYVDHRLTERFVVRTEQRRIDLIQQSALGQLTERQLDIVRNIIDGRSIRDIAELLQLSEKTVESHRYRLMARLGIHDRVSLTRLAIHEGFVRG